MKERFCFALAAGLTREGKKVLGIDLDPQGNFGFSLGLDIEDSKTITGQRRIDRGYDFGNTDKDYEAAAGKDKASVAAAGLSVVNLPPAVPISTKSANVPFLEDPV